MTVVHDWVLPGVIGIILQFWHISVSSVDIQHPGNHSYHNCCCNNVTNKWWCVIFCNLLVPVLWFLSDSISTAHITVANATVITSAVTDAITVQACHLLLTTSTHWYQCYYFQQ